MTSEQWNKYTEEHRKGFNQAEFDKLKDIYISPASYEDLIEWGKREPLFERLKTGLEEAIKKEDKGEGI
jgi:hypothetical protein